MTTQTHVPLIEMMLDSGVRRHSMCDVETDAGYYSPLFKELGPITREVSPFGGEYTASAGEMYFINTGGEFSVLKATESIRNRSTKLLYGDAALGSYSAFSKIATLVMGMPSFLEDATIFKVPIADPVLDRFQASLSRKLKSYTRQVFPNLPVDTPPDLVPLIYGTVSSVGFDNKGAIKATLIDTPEGCGYFRYAAAQQLLLNAGNGDINVYHYGELLPPAYGVSAISYDGRVHTVIDFLVDMRDPDRVGEVEITFDATGYNNFIITHNPIQQLKQFMSLELGVDDILEMNAANLVLYSDVADAKRVKTDFALTDGNWSELDVIMKICGSSGTSFFINKLGQYDVWMFDIGTLVDQLPTSPLLDQKFEMLGDSFQIEYNEHVAAQLQYNWGWNNIKEYFSKQPDTPDVGEAARLGEDIRDNLNLWFSRDSISAKTVAFEQAYFMREDQQYPEFKLPRQFYTLDLNDVVRVTHPRGPSRDGSGYVEAIARIIRIQIGPGTENMEVVVRCQKLLEVGYPDLFLRYMRLGDRDTLAADWDSAGDTDRGYGYLGDRDDPTGSPEGTLDTDDPIKLLF